MTRVLIVDDELPARERLRRLLGGMEDIEIAGEAADGPAAIEQIHLLRPDAVLLDIEMPGCHPDPHPHIIFCTAYDQFAVEAFELRAIDYLLKPVSRARLSDALQRVRSPGPPIGKVPPPQRFLARSGSRYVHHATASITAFLAEDGLTKLCTHDREYWMDPSLNDLEERLDTTQFFRSSTRGAIIRLDEVKEVAPLPGGAGELTLKSGRKLEVSRRRFKGLLNHLTGTTLP